MPPGDCFRCHQPGHWANNCPLKSPTNPKTTDAVTVTSPPVIHCPCNAGVCNVLTSKTVKNPKRRFYICPSVPSCGFFKWCDQVSIKSEPISDNPTCLCGSGPCKRVTVIDGPNAHRSYFVCSIKKSFGACGFFKWEDEAEEEVGNGGSTCSTLIRVSGFDSTDDSNLVQETELDSDGNVKRSRLGVVVVSDLSSTSSNEFTLGNGVVDGVAETVKDYADTLPMNTLTMGKELIPVCLSFNNRKPVSNGSVFASGDGRNQGIAPSFDLITVYDDVGDVEAEEKVLPSLAPPKQPEPQVEALCSDHPANGASSEGVTGLSHNTINPNGKIKPDHKFGETKASFSGSSSLMVDLVEQYNSEKLHFESVSMKHVDALTAFTGSYKQLETLRGRTHSLRKELVEVETQVKLYETESSEFAATLQEVSDEMAKSQKIMAEMARKLAKEVKVYKQSDFAAL
ncbi:hypothetical protein V5N11_009071 [Cardamine amara subsp. amara]|uniref:CCHC-type domain-containing protein n=1 Tax=Cardamine amara subsp. amara TaxID=228776 RepID=A0ABD1C7J3_CARAN